MFTRLLLQGKVLPKSFNTPLRRHLLLLQEDCYIIIEKCLLRKEDSVVGRVFLSKSITSEIGRSSFKSKFEQAM